VVSRLFFLTVLASSQNPFLFGWLYLKETQLLVAKLIPNTFTGKTFNFM